MKHRIRLMQALLNNKRFLGSFLKYFAGAAAVVLATFGMFGALYYNVYSVHLKNTVSFFQERNLYKTNVSISYLMTSVALDAVQLTGDESLLSLMTTAPGDLSGLKHASINQVINRLFNMTVLLPAMDSIYVYSDINGYVATWTEFRPLADFADASFLDVKPDGVPRAREKWTHGGVPNVITISKEIIYNDKRVGVLAFNLGYDRFASYINQGMEDISQSLYVTDKNGQVFFSTVPDAFDAFGVPLPLPGVMGDLAGQGGGVRFDGAKVYTAVWAANHDHAVYSEVQQYEALAFQKKFARLAIWSAAVGLTAALSVALGVSYLQYRNVVRLVSAVGAPYSPEHGSEISYIADSMTGLIARNQPIERELADRMAELKKAQAIALQNQINPHFILNTLQSVNLDILKHTGGDSPATRTVALLSDILKSNLNTTDHIVPLSYEIRQAVKYIEIENIRHRERFHVSFDIDEPLTECRTVKFILQPVLENCFKHGLSGSPSAEKRVSVRGLREGGALVLIISDNGLGIPPEVLNELQTRLKQSHIQENGHIGLCNVDKRIKLVFGSTYGVNISSAPGRGTTVTIKQKLVRGDWT